MSKEIILPCPFCRHSKILAEGNSKKPYCVQMVCQYCGAKGPEVWSYDSKKHLRDLALEMWNRRN